MEKREQGPALLQGGPSDRRKVLPGNHELSLRCAAALDPAPVLASTGRAPGWPDVRLPALTKPPVNLCALGYCPHRPVTPAFLTPTQFYPPFNCFIVHLSLSCYSVCVPVVHCVLLWELECVVGTCCRVIALLRITQPWSPNPGPPSGPICQPQTTPAPLATLPRQPPSKSLPGAAWTSLLRLNEYQCI